MTKYSRFIGTVTLCSVLTGCGGYKQVPLQTLGQVSEEEAGDRGELQVGDKVRATLITGEKIQGNFVSSSVDSIDMIVIRVRGHDGKPQTYSWDNITSIEKYRANALATVAVTGAVILGVSLICYAATPTI